MGVPGRESGATWVVGACGREVTREALGVNAEGVVVCGVWSGWEDVCVGCWSFARCALCCAGVALFSSVWTKGDSRVAYYIKQKKNTLVKN